MAQKWFWQSPRIRQPQWSWLILLPFTFSWQGATWAGTTTRPRFAGAAPVLLMFTKRSSALLHRLGLPRSATVNPSFSKILSKKLLFSIQFSEKIKLKIILFCISGLRNYCIFSHSQQRSGNILQILKLSEIFRNFTWKCDEFWEKYEISQLLGILRFRDCLIKKSAENASKWGITRLKTRRYSRERGILSSSMGRRHGAEPLELQMPTSFLHPRRILGEKNVSFQPFDTSIWTPQS